MSIEMQKINIGEWLVDLVLDEDNHLGVYVTGPNNQNPIALNAWIGRGNEWAERFTTQEIEDEYVREQEGRYE